MVPRVIVLVPIDIGEFSNALIALSNLARDFSGISFGCKKIILSDNLSMGQSSHHASSKSLYFLEAVHYVNKPTGII